jgi:leucine dehydrogenase
MFEELIRAWDGEELVVGFDQPSGTWMFVCIHSTKRGPADGGTRMKTYTSPADAMSDAMRLAAAMTLKMAAIDMPFGARRRCCPFPRFRQVKSAVASSFAMGSLRPLSAQPSERRPTSTRGPTWTSLERGMDMSIAGATSEVGPATRVRTPPTASLTASARAQSWYSARPSSRVGPYSFKASATSAHRSPSDSRPAGTRVLVSDIDRERAHALAERIGAVDVPPEDAVGVDCDVYAPCALGGTLNAETIRQLSCRIVAGSETTSSRRPPTRNDCGQQESSMHPTS